jgi:hypothetical protein
VFLKKFHGAPPATPATLPPIKHGSILPEPEKALRARLNRAVWEIMVKWAGQAAANATWEQVSEFKEAFPSFQLEDELFHNGEECCGCLHWQAISAQAKTGSTSGVIKIIPPIADHILIYFP